MPTSNNAATSTYVSLRVLGVLSIVVGFVTAANGLAHGLPFFTSVSAAGTTGVLAGAPLPFALGAMSLFFLGYVGYDLADRICAKVMSAAAFITAVQPTTSEYTAGITHMGLFALPSTASAIVHGVAALIMFGTMVYWVTFRFTLSNVLQPTREKTLRNRCYRVCGIIAAVHLLLLTGDGVLMLLDIKGIPWVWACELGVFIPLGVAICVKGGVLMGEKV